MTYGKITITHEDIDGGVRTIKTLNVYQDATTGIVYVNAESVREDYLSGTDWVNMTYTTENHYRVHLGKTLDEAIALYKTRTTDAMVWDITMTGVD